MLSSWIKTFGATLLMGTFLASNATANNLETLAAELGVCPESAIVAGVENIAPILNAIDAESGLQQSLASHREALLTASTNVTALWQALEIDSENQSLHSQYESAVAAKLSAQTQISVALQALFEAATENLSEQQVQRLTNWRLSQGRKVPPEFRIKQRTDQDWMNLEIALIAEKRAMRLGTALNEAQAELLADARADLEVIEAATALQNELPLMEAQFEQQVEQLETE